MKNLRFASVPFLAAAAFAGHTACLSPTELSFVITTDVPCSKLNGTAISVGTLGPDLDSHAIGSTSTFCDGTGSLGSLVVVPGPHPQDEVGVRIVTGVGKSPQACIDDKFTGGCIVARRGLRFISHENLDVPVAMNASCIDVACDPDHTCVDGVCVDARSPQGGGCDATTCDGGTDGGIDSGPQPPSKWDPVAAQQTYLNGRIDAAGFWTGSEVWFWGGSGPSGAAVDGLRFNPGAGTWAYLPSATTFTSSVEHPSCFGGGNLVAWGGDTQKLEGAVYDGASWTATSDPSATIPSFKARHAHVIVCAPDGSLAVVWSGWDATTTALNDGAIYHVATKSWTAMAATSLAPRANARAIWVNGKVVVYGGDCGGGNWCSDGGVFDPLNNQWSTTQFVGLPRKPDVVATDGTRAFFWGGDKNGATTEITVLDPANAPPTTVGSSSSFPATAPTPRSRAVAWYSNGRFWIWGGDALIDGGDVPLGDGAYYDFAANTWTAMPAGPSPRYGHALAWTGTEAVLYGGEGAGGDGGLTYLNDAWLFHAP